MADLDVYASLSSDDLARTEGGRQALGRGQGGHRPLQEQLDDPGAADCGRSGLAAHATQELRASGATARKRDPSTQLTLTPMERHVAGLVRQGLSNKDIAVHCWVSPRTVAFHLRNIFTKTGVTSRRALAQLDLR